MPPVGEHSRPGSGVPDLDCFVAAGRGDTPAVGRPGYTKDHFRVPLINKLGPPCDSVPELDGCIGAGRDEALPIRRPGHGNHRAGMPSIDELSASCDGIPQLDGCIGASRSDALSAGGPGYANHRIAMPFVCEQDRAYGAFIPAGIPYAYKVVTTAGGNSFTIRRPGDAQHVFTIPAIHLKSPRYSRKRYAIHRATRL